MCQRQSSMACAWQYGMCVAVWHVRGSVACAWQYGMCMGSSRHVRGGELCVRVCACMCLRVSVRAYMIYVHVCAFVYMCVHVAMYVSVCACLCMCAHVCMRGGTNMCCPALSRSSSHVFTARRPFHPCRLWALLSHGHSDAGSDGSTSRQDPTLVPGRAAIPMQGLAPTAAFSPPGPNEPAAPAPAAAQPATSCASCYCGGSSSMSGGEPGLPLPAYMSGLPRGLLRSKGFFHVASLPQVCACKVWGCQAGVWGYGLAGWGCQAGVWGYGLSGWGLGLRAGRAVYMPPVATSSKHCFAHLVVECVACQGDGPFS